jgi:hypothetical protein
VQLAEKVVFLGDQKGKYVKKGTDVTACAGVHDLLLVWQASQRSANTILLYGRTCQEEIVVRRQAPKAIDDLERNPLVKKMDYEGRLHGHSPPLCRYAAIWRA